MHIVGFIAGALGVSAVVVAVALGVGFSGWVSIAMGLATFFLAQLLYVVWIAGMARAEARRQTSARLPDAAPPEPKRGAVQKG